MQKDVAFVDLTSRLAMRSMRSTVLNTVDTVPAMSIRWSAPSPSSTIKLIPQT